MIRVVRPDGWLYYLAEDYGMIFVYPTKYDPDEFWREYAGKSAIAAGSNLRQGRTMPALLQSLGCRDIEIRFLSIDSTNAGRDLLAEIFTHWRDGFEDWIHRYSGKSLPDIHERFNDIIEGTKNPDGYAVWLIPSISARVPKQ
jgi:hypothetical protein